MLRTGNAVQPASSSLILMIGFYARFAGLDIPVQDTVVREYLIHEFSGTLMGELTLTFIFITLLAAGMSTLDGILVSLSAMVVNDIVTPLTGSTEKGLVWSRWVLIGVGIIGLVVAWNPPQLIGLFAQKGVYGLAAASLVPMLFGVLIKGPIPLWIAAGAAITGLLAHFYLNLLGGVVNPAVSASYAILLSGALASSALLISRVRARSEKNL